MGKSGKVAERLQRFNSLLVENTNYPRSAIGIFWDKSVLFLIKNSVLLAHLKSMVTAVLLFL